jgi:hypothetical protein
VIEEPLEAQNAHETFIDWDEEMLDVMDHDEQRYFSSDVLLQDAMKKATTSRHRQPKRRWAPIKRIQSRDLLVIVSDSGLLSMLAYGPISAADYCLDEDVKQTEGKYGFFLVYEHALGDIGLPYDQAGHHLCVDSLSRALAVAGWQNDLRVFLLQSPTADTSNTGSASKLNVLQPFAREFTINEDFGLITSITFLRPAPHDKRRILLAVTSFR